MLPAVIKKFFAPRISGEDVAPAKPAGQVTDKVPAREEIVWEDDSILRSYAQDSRDGKTNWVIAGDLRELYANVAAFNRGRSEQDQLRVEIATPIADKLRALRDANLHNPSRNGVDAHKGPLVVEGDMFLKLFGPGVLEGIRLRLGDAFVNAVYINDSILSTSLTFEAPDGHSRSVYFKGDSHREFVETPDLLPFVK